MDFPQLASTPLVFPPPNPNTHALPGQSFSHQGVVMVFVVLASVVRVG